MNLFLNPLANRLSPETTGLLLSRDLIFTSKIKGTAAEFGYSMMVADTESQAQSMIETHRPSVVFVDLNAGMLVAQVP